MKAKECQEYVLYRFGSEQPAATAELVLADLLAILQLSRLP